MSELKELLRLKEEERALMNIASKLSDQLNRLKVEELALLNIIRKAEEKEGGDNLGESGADNPEAEEAMEEVITYLSRLL